jgi:hypothetical protein
MTKVEAEWRSLNDSVAELLGLLDDAEGKLEVVEESISLKGEIHRKYEWFYLTERAWEKGRSGQAGSGFNRSEYLYFATGEHLPDTEDGFFQEVLSLQSGDVNELADDLYRMGATDLQRASNILKFVQYLPYIYDDDSDTYVRHPLETLIEGGGDCEDTSLLTAQLMRRAGPEGFPAVLLTVDTDGDAEVDHMMVGVSLEGATGTTYEFNGTSYYVCETTSRSYRVGVLPSGYEIKNAIGID